MDWIFVLDVALICCVVMLCVAIIAMICEIINNAIKLHEKRIKKLNDVDEKVRQLENTVLWIRQDVDDCMLNIHNIENEISKKGVNKNEKDNRKNSY